VTTAKRMPAVPHLPPIAEAGVPGSTSPHGMGYLRPPRRRRRSFEDCMPIRWRALNDQATKERLEQLGVWWWARRRSNLRRFSRRRWTNGHRSSGSRHQHSASEAKRPDKGRRTQLIGIAAALTFAAAFGPAAFAQTPTETWPNRFIRLIVPFPPGGGADAIARILSARLSDTWGQQV